MKENCIILGQYVVLDDDTGTEILHRRRKIREDIERVLEILEPHRVAIKKIHEQSFWNPMLMGNSHSVTLEFETTEDYTMANLLIKDLVDKLKKQNSW